MVLLCWYLDYLCVLVWFVKVFYACDLGDLTLCYDWVTYRLEALKLHLQKPFNNIVFLNWRNFDSDLHLSLFSLSYLEPDFLKILKPLIASDRKNILIQIIKLLITTLSNNPEHKWIIGPIILKYLIFQFNHNINFLNRSWKECGFTKRYAVSIDVDEVFGFGELCSTLYIFLRWFAHILLVGLGLGFALFGWLGRVGEFEVLGQFLDFGSFALLGLVYESCMDVLYGLEMFGFWVGFSETEDYLVGVVFAWSLMGTDWDEES